jgi:aspartate racemase
MVTAGLVGGLGPESTIDYYRRILEAWRQHDPSSSPALVIDSLDVQLGLRLVASDRAGFTDYLLGSIRRLAAAGVDFIAITANTPHLIFDDLAAQSSVPLISIVEVCARAARQRALSRLLLLGTRFTMEATFYPEVCARFGLSVIVPDAADRTWIHDCYVNELLKGQFHGEARAALLRWSSACAVSRASTV